MNRSIKLLGALAVVAIGTATAFGDDRVSTAAPPLAVFSVSDNVLAHAPVTFDASASTAAAGGALAYGWDFGHGARVRGAKVAHVFAQPGVYTVTLTVVDSAGHTSRESRQVTVAPAVAPTMTAKR